MKIEIKNLNKKFAENVLFDDFSLTIDSNELIIIKGISGAGKTTLLNMIGTLETYDSGEILYGGEPIKNNKDIRLLRQDKLSFIFQNYGLIDNEKVFENFKVIHKFRNYSDEKLIEVAEEYLGKVGLKGFAKRVIYGLSGGEQQRVSIAKALAKNADIVFADEPTASVDEDNKLEILELFRTMNQQGTTVIIVTHDMSVVEFFEQARVINLNKKS